MCGRFALHARPEVVALQFALGAVPPLAPRYNIAPASEILVVREGGAAALRWGLVPRWAKDPAAGARMINARAETVAGKPSFREAYRRRRCLVPASGFYEWRRSGPAKQPFYVRPAAGELFAFAGLWERWEGPDGPLETCAVITTQANEVMAPIHDRMPVIIPPGDHSRWLDCAPRNDVGALLRPCDPGSILAHPVSRAVNSARNDSPELILPLES
jgi:putative SOS response-associated peptidase YedK